MQFGQHARDARKAGQSILTELQPWGHLYEIAIEQLLPMYVHALGIEPELVKLLEAPDPVRAMVAFVEADNSDWADSPERQLTPMQMLSVLQALSGSLECLALHGCYLPDLVASVRDNGDDKALFDAVRIDPLAATSPTIAKRLGIAVAEGDESFLRLFRLAMQGKTGKQARFLKGFRFYLQVLHETGELERPIKEIRADVLKLRLYANGPSASKNVTELIRKFRKGKAISK